MSPEKVRKVRTHGAPYRERVAARKAAAVYKAREVIRQLERDGLITIVEES